MNATNDQVVGKPEHVYTEELRRIKLSDYTYELPEARIAQEPLEQRDTANLLVYRKGNIHHYPFSSITAELDKGSLLVFNDTKVIRARLFLRRETGALIEILLLHPTEPREVHMAMQAEQQCVWKCMVGRKKRWKDGELLK